MTSRRVLIIEDETLVAHVLCDGLRACGFDAEAAGSGEEGLAAFRADRPEIVVTDVFMPDREGLEILREIKREAPEAKVVAMSGGGRMISADCVLDMARKLGADAVLQKPFRIDDLVAVIEGLEHRPRAA
ncbi:MAG: response regulator [Alphaproteobacteria bacterium]|nr:response regulator [Alphaproteobacteria bacterium]